LSDATVGLAELVQRLARLDDAAVQSDLLLGMLKGLEGRRTVAQPAEWSVTFAKLSKSSRAEVRDAALRLALVFDDPLAIQFLSQQAADVTRIPVERVQAIEALIGRRPDA
jgi:hypothetical protein